MTKTTTTSPRCAARSTPSPSRSARPRRTPAKSSPSAGGTAASRFAKWAKLGGARLVACRQAPRRQPQATLHGDRGRNRSTGRRLAVSGPQNSGRDAEDGPTRGLKSQEAHRGGQRRLGGVSRRLRRRHGRASRSRRAAPPSAVAATAASAAGDGGHPAGNGRRAEPPRRRADHGRCLAGCGESCRRGPAPGRRRERTPVRTDADGHARASAARAAPDGARGRGGTPQPAAHSAAAEERMDDEEESKSSSHDESFDDSLQEGQSRQGRQVRGRQGRRGQTVGRRQDASADRFSG